MDDTINNNTQDDFNFDNFLTDESKKELGIVPEATPVATEPEVITESSPVKVTETPTPVVEKTVEVDTTTAPVVTESHETVETGPVRAPNEPEWKYEYRKEIWDKQQALKNATTDDDKSALKSELQELRKEVAQISKMKEQDTYEPETDAPEGYVKKDEIVKIIEERERVAKLDLLEQQFIASKPKLQSKANYDMLMSYVGETYNLTGKNERQLSAILNMAYDDLFPDNSAQKIEKAKEVSKTLDAVDFSGSGSQAIQKDEKAQDKELVEKIKAKSGEDFSWVL
jgi:hypothetical protein